MVNYLYQILLEQDCVVLPGFGGFITQYKPAELNFRTNEISPPGKKIAFNPSSLSGNGNTTSKKAISICARTVIFRGSW